ncbi:MAG: aminotransferase class V-fold PLP-dependent enzyme [Syntrophobacteraceae bacterium]
MKELSEYREEFPITRDFVFFNNAAVSSPPSRVIAAVSDLFTEFGHHGITRYPQWMKQVEKTRSLFARLINADPHEVCFVGNTSDGLSTVAGGLAWRPGERVLVPVPDFPSNVYPWVNLERQGVKIDYFQKDNGRFSPRDIESALRPGTKLVTISSTDFSTGFRCDLEALGELCRRKGILLCVDAIQSLGAAPLDVKKFGVHFLASGGHKWLLATMGIGALYIAPEANHLIHPAHVGWRSVQNEEDFYSLELKLKLDARRFESGTLNVPGITALGASLEMLLEAGIERIHARILDLNDMLASGLSKRNFEIVTPMEREHRAGILSFLHDDVQGLFRFFLNNKVMVAPRGSAVRLSPHFYNDESDIGKFFTVLDEYLRKR